MIPRRSLLKGALCMTAGGLFLPTESSGDDLGHYGKYLGVQGPNPAVRGTVGIARIPTEDNILGPFYREHAPMRGKISPPLAEGTTLLVSGTVYGADSQKPLSMALLDIWHADCHGSYENGQDADPQHSKQPFVNRIRMFTDEQGRYEWESIHPGAYKIDEKTWRPSHVHYWIRADGYKDLITQLYFEGDQYNGIDRWIKPSLIMPVNRVHVGQVAYEAVHFDIVLKVAE